MDISEATIMTIRKLSPILINQIAAGEVVDRPASVVKELVENALDARSTRIEIQLEHGGKDLIRVSDNGCGIAAEELPLAVASHATSKITDEADLAAIASLGFRGEAIASVGSVSHLTITSRREEDESAMQIIVDGGDTSISKPIAASVGTTVEVRRLFYNTPARRKFLKSDGAETTRVRDVVQRLAASHHETGFTLKSADRTILAYTPSSATARLLDIFGGELSGEMIECSGETEGVRLWGLIGKPEVARPTSKYLRVHVNGRTISDSSMTHAIKEAYRGLIEPNRWPTAAIFIEMDPALVDVNVHPQKSEVRFRDRDIMWRLVNKSVSSTLSAENFVPLYNPKETYQHVAKGSQQSFGTGMQSTFPVDQAREAVAGIDLTQPTPMPTILASNDVLQVHKCFLVTQDEQGLLIIDQHALHERVMFEELKARMAEGNLESQQLLVPESFPADSAWLDAIETQQALFTKLGIEISPSGPASISVYALPTLLVSRNVDGTEFICDLLDKLGSNNLPATEEEALSEILDMMSCKAAIKAGDQLTQHELRDLLQRRREIERSSNCPHGRPTTMRLSIEELEQRFGRR
jgi:DNA mismatch repair protein MutL|tara:strand:- start:1197 stop:2945 length:1749 start_codon:yes stop_codon:yes gene_type:complete